MRPSERNLKLACKEEPAQNCQSWEDKLKNCLPTKDFILQHPENPAHSQHFESSPKSTTILRPPQPLQH